MRFFLGGVEFDDGGQGDAMRILRNMTKQFRWNLTRNVATRLANQERSANGGRVHRSNERIVTVLVAPLSFATSDVRPGFNAGILWRRVTCIGKTFFVLKSVNKLKGEGEGFSKLFIVWPNVFNDFQFDPGRRLFLVTVMLFRRIIGATRLTVGTKQDLTIFLTRKLRSVSAFVFADANSDHMRGGASVSLLCCV